MEPYRRRVHYYETDRMGVVHHSNYIRWMEEARVDFLDQLGFGYARLEQLGVFSPVVSVQCRYKAPAAFDDEVTVRVWVEAFNGVKLTVGYEMTRADGAVVCQATSEHCFTGPEGRLLRLKKQQPDLCAALEAQISCGPAGREEGRNGL